MKYQTSACQHGMVQTGYVDTFKDTEKTQNGHAKPQTKMRQSFMQTITTACHNSKTN